MRGKGRSASRQNQNQTMKNETNAQYIEATPTWAEILPLLLAGAENGSAEARAELLRMARIADAYIAAKKGGVL